MEIVEGKPFLHVNVTNSRNKGQLLRVGETITIGKSFNPYRESFEHGFGLLRRDIPTLTNTVALYWHFTLETIFEEERIKINPELPSRLKCLWMTDRNQLNYWIEKVKIDSSKLQVLEMSTVGKVFKCDAYWVEMQPAPLTQVRENAQSYWQGEIKDPSKIEFLFEGDATVTSILNV